ncbi:PilZ domain-containing protein [Thiomicrorhabdus indica]|uniref:PilZ domain-containing protein n=1 Tax=Thiomicrorhabdus indica TaxID=2267253 RepID=UPI002AA6133B|nr:PilZ domain-containing protein [Thiomicrorhabdus indica]
MRVKTDRRVTLIGKNGQAKAQMVDISTDGAGVLTPRGAKVGTELELVFEIPTAEYFQTLKILGTVTHRHHTEQGIYLELTFDDLSFQEERYIREFVDYKNRLHSMGKRSYGSPY